jgi:nucleoside-diphosphate-sugar epimerase
VNKALVTGGAGFIGSHLVEALVGLGYHTTIVDDLSTGKMENISDFLGREKAEFVRGSVTDLSLLKKLCKGVNYIFHLAAIASVPRSIDNPQLSHEVNVGGTLNVLLAARDNGAEKVVLASSAAIYGNSPALPQKEESLPHPLSPYAANKLAAEYYCQVFSEVYKLPTVCLRYFNIYGPRQDVNSEYAAVIPWFISEVLRGNPPVILGDGEQTRDFAYVKDAVAANILALKSGVTGVFNIGQGKSTSINQLAELITGLIGRDVKPAYRETRLGDVRHSLADITRAQAVGYSPKYDLKAGLAETIRWFT